MNPTSRAHPAHVPTLTEVIEVDPSNEPAPLLPQRLAFGAITHTVSTPPPPVVTPLEQVPVSEGHLAQRVLNDVQRQIDSMLEFRLREALAPVLALHSEAIVRDLKDELARTMRDVVARAVAQEVAKQRQR